MNLRLLLLLWSLVAAPLARTQSPAVPLFPTDSRDDSALKSAAAKLRESGALVPEATLTSQLTRTNCTLTLPGPRKSRLSGRELWAAARAAHIRIGWNFLCTRCNNWHLDLAGGYAITKDGAVATCHHVVKRPANFKEGALVAADEDGRVFPVIEVLAANARADACILRVAAKDLKPLPLNTDVAPGDRCFCFSDPLSQRGYFSDGIVNRFLARHPNNSTNAPPVTRLNVTTDWAPGSSGSAVLDEFGNAIGHVTTITTLPHLPAKSGEADKGKTPERTLITLHEAVGAKDVLALIQKPGKR
ncbi:MAG: serine protease [Limisphaerales bacterium]|nr:MAG: serine protease [Limisphaerales bacterium]KAG0510592.1 MAG: serine protease [Limisphaerales bacterium]TXT52864.1 MAG: serine protease [Limisphaerales bacterium]